MDTRETEQVLPTLQLDMVNKAKREKKTTLTQRSILGKQTEQEKKHHYHKSYSFDKVNCISKTPKFLICGYNC